MVEPKKRKASLNLRMKKYRLSVVTTFAPEPTCAKVAQTGTNGFFWLGEETWLNCIRMADPVNVGALRCRHQSNVRCSSIQRDMQPGRKAAGSNNHHHKPVQMML